MPLVSTNICPLKIKVETTLLLIFVITVSILLLQLLSLLYLNLLFLLCLITNLLLNRSIASNQILIEICHSFNILWIKSRCFENIIDIQFIFMLERIENEVNKG